MIPGSLRLWLFSRWLVLFGLLLVVLVQPGAASGLRVELPAGSSVLTAGQAVELHWGRLPEDAEEMELLLDIGGDNQLIVRLTPQLGPGIRSYLWQVPNLPSTTARLRLRWGSGGVETMEAPGRPFVISANLTAPVDHLHYHHGEWWLGGRPPTELTGRAPELVLGARPEHSLVASLSDSSDASPQELECRQLRAPGREPCRSGTHEHDPQLAPRKPLTIPLRP